MKKGIVVLLVYMMSVIGIQGQNLIERIQLGLELDAAVSGNNLAREIGLSSYQKTNRTFALFEYVSNKGNKSNDIGLVLDQQVLKRLKSVQEGVVELRIPVSRDAYINVLLRKFNLLSRDFKVLLGCGEITSVPSEDLVFYRGIVEDDPSSMVSLSIGFDEVQISISDQAGIYRVVPKDLKSYTYNLYIEKPIDKSIMTCGTEGSFFYVGERNPAATGTKTPENKKAGDIVEVYFECDYALYNSKGGTNGTLSYLNALFTEIATFYANENAGIYMEMTSPKIWNVTDPYVNESSTFGMLDLFGRTVKDNYPGRLASLLSGRQLNGGNIGGIAWIDVLCDTYNPTYNFGPYSFLYNVGNSSINPYPQYSVDVSILAHELGHNFGSEHTHDCVWGPNHDQAIDYCGGNNCSLSSNAEDNTIMSYCSTVEFTKGFGVEPGALVYNNYVNATCLKNGYPDCTHESLTYQNSTISGNTVVYVNSIISIDNNVVTGTEGAIQLNVESDFEVIRDFTIPATSVLEINIEICN